jgi:phosphatidylserine/phosphatidylglycerophosphate/cardiolipin synthase-like enzyme
LKKPRLLLFAIVCAVLYSFLIKTALYPSLPTVQNPCILYSNQKRDDFRLVLKKAFELSHQSIDIWMYAITDHLLLKQLESKARQGTYVHLYFDKKGGTPSLPDSLHPKVVKSKGLMHRKIVILDEKMFFIGSANMTTSSLQLHDNLSIGIYHKEAAMFLKSPAAKSFKFGFHQQEMKGILWLLPDLKALEEIQSKLDNAKESIFVAMFTLTQKDLIQKLIRAHERGVKVIVALDRYTASGASKKSIEMLMQSGVQVLVSSGLPLLHHKWAYIDRDIFIMGSTNWTEAAFRKNDDILLFLEHLTPSVQHALDRLASTIQIESKRQI